MRSTHRAPRSVALLAVAIGMASAVAAPVDAAVGPAKFDYRITTLDNGLTVILSEDHSTPIVNLQMWYHVGSKNEPEGRTGFAHLFEHLMFKGSQNVRTDEHLSMISSVGGVGNAYTTEDVTVFFETVPSQYLPARALARGGSDGYPPHQPADARFRARSGQGGAALALRERAVRAAERDPVRRGVHDASVQAPDDRLDGGYRGGFHRGRPGVSSIRTTSRKTPP